MAYKKIEHDFSFADIAVQKFADKNRSMLFLRQVNNTIDWQPVQDLLYKYYQTGKTKKGERAYPPLLLFKCFLLQKWFQIKSDPDFDSDWTVKNEKPHYGLKEHTSVDTKNGFILSTNLSPASHHDSKYLPLAVIASMHTPDKIQTTYADKGYLPG